jgi:uncharacterized protein HemX
MAIFAILMSVIALGAAAFTWYQVQFTQQQNTSDVIIGLTEIRGRIEQLGREMDRINTEQQGFVSREGLELAIGENIAVLRERQDDLTDAVDRISADIERGVDAWALEEVEQMLRMANQGLALTGNRDSAIKALRLADSGLQVIADPRYTAVRVAIAEEIGALEVIDLPDIAGIASELAVLADAVSSLPLINEPDGVALDQPLIAIDEEAEDSWRQELRRLASDLVGLVTIQKVSESPRPLLKPEQRYFLEQNLKLMLFGAQLALLQNEDEIFRRNIEQSVDWVESYYDVKQPRSAKFLLDLNRIENVKLGIKLPDISGSLMAYRRVGRQENPE